MQRLTSTLLLLLLAGAVLRFAGLGHFPDLNPDEGLWTNSTKNFLVFGDWFMDGRKHLFLSPVFHGLSLAAFAAFDASIATARGVSALLGTLSIALFYLTIRELTGEVEVATAASILFGFGRFALYVSRSALLESTTLFFVLAAVYLIARKGRFWLAAGGLMMGVALLTKTTAICIVPSIALLVALPGDRPKWRDRLLPSSAFVAVAGLVAVVGYGSMYLWQPERFVAAFTFELDGVHFGTRPETLFSVGRFAFAPGMVARTVDSLSKEFPLLFALGLLGMLVAWDRDSERREFWFFGSWLAVATSFFLLQLYQPIRYFFLVTPALAYFGAVLLARLRTAVTPATSRWLSPAFLAIYLAYSVGGFAANALLHPATRLTRVVAWANENAAPDAVFMAAAYFCTDLPQRAYSHHDFARSGADLLRNIDAFNVTYVIYDNVEWSPDLLPTLERNLDLVQAWDFGAVYRVRPEEFPTEE